ncbi:cytochrome P450 89A2-like [Mercurialis annua]|uniref:cytochrome P450 89A2-like n=1 Tax=Mercurialis annua TaxID=3986 RepID=UPI00215DD594|nr:cytochrome P450 89A2-like [Mercurialis annua]
MEIWFLILMFIVSLVSIFILIKSIFPTTINLPPGPLCYNLILIRNFVNLEPILSSLHAKFGAIFTLYAGHIPVIFIADHALAYESLVHKGAIFSDRPPDFAISKVLSSNHCSVTTGFYGPTWRLLRRNLTSEILHPLRVKSYGHTRKRIVQNLKNSIETQARSVDSVSLTDNLHFSLFSLLAFMCFGENIDEKQIKEIENVQREILLCYRKYNRLNFFPRLTKIFMRRQWKEFLKIRKNQEDVIIPLINARKKLKEENKKQERFVVSYVDALLDLELPGAKRKLDDQEMISLCSEFLNAGTDTTATALEWIMANLVKYPKIQENIFNEIKVVKIKHEDQEEVKEEDMQTMPYLKAVILEGLRRHPPVHFVLPHAVTEDTVLDKYRIPRKAVVNYLVAEMGVDPRVWEDPKAFKPERFLNNNSNNGDDEAFDVTGSREIKMMPFGVGRRICPGYSLAMLLLEYFVANLIWKFEFKAVDGDEIDLSEKPEFTVVMKNPLQAQISPRFIK